MNGDRIEALLAEIRATADPPALGRVEELVRCLVEVYGSALARILALLSENGAMTDSLASALAADPLVAALLTLHGLHPRDVTARIEAALDRVRPYLDAHAGGVLLVGVDERRVARIRLEGTCDGCASSEATLRQLIERAIQEGAPELAGIEVENAKGPMSSAPLVQIRRPAP